MSVDQMSADKNVCWTIAYWPNVCHQKCLLDNCLLTKCLVPTCLCLLAKCLVPTCMCLCLCVCWQIVCWPNLSWPNVCRPNLFWQDVCLLNVFNKLSVDLMSGSKCLSTKSRSSKFFSDLMSVKLFSMKRRGTFCILATGINSLKDENIFSIHPLHSESISLNIPQTKVIKLLVEIWSSLW
jgi:hypothetical protein